MVWDDDNIKLLQKLWDKGLSTTEIAKKMNVSKNSIVGKVHRLCLKARPSPIKKKEDNSSQNTESAVVEEIIEETVAPTKTESTDSKVEKVSKKESVAKENNKQKQEQTKQNKKTKYIKLVELDSHTCRWPIGDPRDEDFCFCGQKVRAGQTYCDEHSQIAYVKALAKK